MQTRNNEKQAVEEKRDLELENVREIFENWRQTVNKN
jgi:hypothetical protein